MIMELRNRKGELMTQIPVSIDMRIMPLDSPPTTPTFGMVFDENAKNVLLEFKTSSDYSNGNSAAQKEKLPKTGGAVGSTYGIVSFLLIALGGLGITLNKRR